jgi:hypothetical protein
MRKKFSRKKLLSFVGIIRKNLFIFKFNTDDSKYWQMKKGKLIFHNRKYMFDGGLFLFSKNVEIESEILIL